MTGILAKEKIKTHPQTAWLFDVDGVLTDPQAKRITQPEIFDELIKRLEKREPIGLNTGRSLEFIISKILDPLEASLKEKNLLRNIIAVGEKGAAWITYDDNGTKMVNVDPNISVPQKIQDQIRELIDKTPYSDTMFYDETKRTMVSVELKPDKTIAEFKKPQQELISALQILLKKYHLEDVLKIDPTRICTDLENKHVGKAFGARKFVELLREMRIEPQEYIGFGDSASDYEMFEELIHLNKKAHFVFVGGKEHLTGKKDFALITFTEHLFDKGTLEYLQSH